MNALARRSSRGTEGRSSTLARRHKPDYRIVLYMGLLMMFGLIIMFAIGPQRAQVLNSAYGSNYDGTYFFVKQSTSLLMALAAFFIVSKIKLSWWQAHAKQLFVIGMAASLILAIGGWIGLGIVQCSLGACRWFNLGPLGSIQPAEFLKFGVTLFGASFLAYRSQQGVINDIYKTILPYAGILLLVAIFVIGIQKDMGTGLVIFAIMASMLLVSGINARMGSLMLGGALVLGLLMIVTAGHRMDRIATFFQGDSGSTKDASAYHIEHAKIAIGSGGLNGVGIGNSVQATGYLPEAINDSVFAIMGEMFGFVGLSVTLILFLALLLSILNTAGKTVTMHEKLIVVGVFGWLAAHVILNVAAMTGVFPLTGITLPLLSFGGTSMVFIAGALGLAFQLSSYTTHDTQTERSRYENSYGRRGVGRSRHAVSSRL